ncbi:MULTISPECIES: DEAD/DEAH box helicase [Shewanella]|uniref:DEAD/DEAH box helicase n=1 Tax=Shewanella TaxID=22 RepID=UPI00201AE7FB|nr:DEAD/DEAH box helicase [Shewanella sp. 10B]
MKIYSQAVNHEDFIRVFDKLLEKLFLEDKITDSVKIDLHNDEIKKATWLASIAALSDNDKERNMANAFGALLHLTDKENEIYKRACYILQSRTGNLITSSHIPKLFQKDNILKDYGTLLNFELAAHRALLEHEFSDKTKIFFTEFQKKLWEHLNSGENVAISAPTSAGKSFIIKKYIIELVKEGAKNIIFIVPTKALINQVSNELKSQFHENAHVYTTYIANEEDDLATIYVLTPERCLKLLQHENASPPKLIFMDEVHNIESGSRGVIFENILYRVISTWSSTQLVVAGPFISSLSDSIKKICNISIIDHQTLSSPVFQVRSALTFYPSKKIAQYRISSPTQRIISGEIKLKKSLYSKIKGNKGEALEVIADMFSPEEHNIYYAPTKSSAEKWASKIAPVIASKNPKIIEAADSRIKDLIDFLEEEVHPDYSLIRALRLGVAYHHAGLPDIARQEVEELFSESIIKNIVCTSTLLQGVNLPADRLIVISPKVDKSEMADFDFLNLLGRAGRANTKLYGEIYCIDVVDDEWGSKRLETDVNKTVDTSSNLFLRKNEHYLSLIADMSSEEIREITGDKNFYGNLSYLRSVFKTDRNHFDRILLNSGIATEIVKDFSSKLESMYSEMSIPQELIAKNPFIDPILQNKLFIAIETEGISNWLISRKPMSKGGIDTEIGPFSEISYYNQLLSVFRRLNDIFNIEFELNSSSYSIDDYINIGRLVRDAHRWMSGKKHKFFILDVIGENNSDEDAVDKAARRITTHISKNLTFIAVKYLMLWSDMLSYFLSEENVEENAYILNLPSMLEMGSYDPVVLELMSCGINRSVALSISSKVKNIDVSAEKALAVINKDRLPNIFKRHLIKAGY